MVVAVLGDEQRVRVIKLDVCPALATIVEAPYVRRLLGVVVSYKNESFSGNKLDALSFSGCALHDGVVSFFRHNEAWRESHHHNKCFPFVNPEKEKNQ